MPISCTIVKIADKLIVDPTVNEVKLTDARLTVGVLPGDVICALQKGGDSTLFANEIDEMVALAMQTTSKLRKSLEK